VKEEKTCVFLLFYISRHVTRVAKYIKSKRPNIKLFVWHDMLSQVVNSGFNNVRQMKKKKSSISSTCSFSFVFFVLFDFDRLQK